MLIFVISATTTHLEPKQDGFQCAKRHYFHYWHRGQKSRVTIKVGIEGYSFFQNNLFQGDSVDKYEYFEDLIY